MFNLSLDNIKKPNESWCYVFGDGPSVKHFELKYLSDGPSISCGQLFLRNDFRYLDTRLISGIEPWLFWPSWTQNQHYLKDYGLISKNMRNYIKSNKNIRFVINLSNLFFIRSRNVSFYHRKIVKNNQKVNEVAKIMDPFGGSFSTQIILAHLLGYKKIYLVGFDSWVLNEASSNRWYEFGEGEFIPNRGYALDFLNIMSDVMEIEIISLQDNYHPTLQSKTYEQHTGIKPVYQENFCLLSSEKLELLASFPQYKVYK